MAPFPLDKAELVSIFVETFLSGAFAVLFGVTLYVLLSRRATGRLNKPMLSAAIAMFIVVELHVSFNFARMVDAFITHRADGTTILYLTDQPAVKNMIKSTLLNVQISIGDILLAYRCWLIWRSWKVIFVPVTLALGSIVTGVGVINALANLKSADAVFVSQLSSWVYGELTVTFCNNVICTSLIALKIWKVERGVRNRADGQSLMPLIRILVESGALAAMTSMITLVTYSRGSNAQIIVLDAMAPISAIAFTLIIVRAGLGSTLDASSGQSPSTRLPLSRGETTTTSRHQYPMQPVAVRITRVQHSDLENKNDGENSVTSVGGGDSFLPSSGGKDASKWNDDDV